MGLSQTQKDLVAGSAGGIAQVLVGQVRLRQLGEDTDSSRLISSKCASRPRRLERTSRRWTAHRRSSRMTVRWVSTRYAHAWNFILTEKGTLTPLLGIGACVSIQFGALEWAKRFFLKRNGGRELSLPELYAAGSIGGLANTVVAGPVEHIRIRLQTQPSNPKLYNGPLDCVAKLYKSNGIAGVFKGQVPTMWRDGIGYG